jgi:hypothetical protein
MSYLTYKVIHYLGIFLLLGTLGAAFGRAGLDVSGGHTDPLRKRWGILHGVGVFLILLGGFGLMARIGIQHGEPFPLWIWIKLGVWVGLGAILWVGRRWPRSALVFLNLVFVLAAGAAYAAVHKPR